MANKIRTQGMTTNPLETEHNGTWSTRDWVRAHKLALQGDSVDGDNLATCWDADDGAGGTVEKCEGTDRLTNEDDATFLARHVGDFLVEMVACPPVP